MASQLGRYDEEDASDEQKGIYYINYQRKIREKIEKINGSPPIN